MKKRVSNFIKKILTRGGFKTPIKVKNPVSLKRYKYRGDPHPYFIVPAVIIVSEAVK